jgi:hypothetical protein
LRERFPQPGFFNYCYNFPLSHTPHKTTLIAISAGS